MSERCASRARQAFAVGALAAASLASALPVPERVTFDSLDRGADGAPVRINALLYLPEGVPPTQGLSAVIALHGCGGMYSTERGRETVLSRHNLLWVGELLADGHAVLFPDSFNPRGRREVCTIKPTERGIGPPVRRLDALGALAWLAAHPGIDGERIALLGFSHGGSSTLETVNARDPAIVAARATPGAPAFFRAAVAFYPGCTRFVRAGDKWRPAVPTRIAIGAADDWTPAAPCVALGAAQRAHGEPLDVAVYPDSYHGFDGPGRYRIVRKDVTTGVDPKAGVTLAPNPVTGPEARDRTRAFLRQRLAPRPAYVAAMPAS